MCPNPARLSDCKCFDERMDCLQKADVPVCVFENTAFTNVENLLLICYTSALL